MSGPIVYQCETRPRKGSGSAGTGFPTLPRKASQGGKTGGLTLPTLAVPEMRSGLVKKSMISKPPLKTGQPFSYGEDGRGALATPCPVSCSRTTPGPPDRGASWPASSAGKQGAL